MSNDKRLTRPVTFRTTEEGWDELQRRAEEAGCSSVSEFARLKVEDDPREGMRHDLYWSKEFSKSAVALCNIILMRMGLQPEAIMEMLPERKAALTIAEMGVIDE